MIKRFTDGIIFGAGFAFSFIVLWYLAAYVIQPIITESQIEHINSEYPSAIIEKLESSRPDLHANEESSTVPFYDLDIDDQIKQSSVIALAKYEASQDGKVKAIIKEFLKKEPETTFYYDVGDEYQSASYYPEEKTSYGDGVVIFFTGSPARMRMSMSYSGDRIRGLGDLPMKLFREKCE